MITECPKKGCDAEIQASVPCWLSLGPDGKWEITGFGDESATLYCAEDHPIVNRELHDSLSAFLEEARPGTTWVGSAPPHQI